MKKYILAITIGIIFSLSYYVRAQGPQNIDLTSTTCPGVGCATFTTAGQGSFALQIVGTWTGTLTFYGSVDGTNFVVLNLTPPNSTTGVSTTTANGVWGASVAGLTSVRVLVTSTGTGTATVTGRSTLSARASSPGSSGGGGGGTVTTSGSPLANQLAVFSGATTITGFGNWNGSSLFLGASVNMADVDPGLITLNAGSTTAIVWQPTQTSPQKNFFVGLSNVPNGGSSRNDWDMFLGYNHNCSADSTCTTEPPITWDIESFYKPDTGAAAQEAHFSM